MFWHYGFTPEELDFIINYDVKYRMGKESEEGIDLALSPSLPRKGNVLTRVQYVPPPY